MSKDPARTPKPTGLTRKIAGVIVGVTAILVAVTSLLRATTGFVTETQPFTCRLGVTLPWCLTPVPEPKVQKAPVDVIQVCETDLDNAREQKNLAPLLNMSALQLFEEAVKSCKAAGMVFDKSKLDKAQEAKAQATRDANKIKEAYDLCNEAFTENTP